MGLNLSSFLQMRFNFYLIRKLGWTFTYVYVYVLVKVYFFFKRNEKRTIAASIRSVFGDNADAHQLKSLSKSVYHGIFSHYYEKIFNAFSALRTLRTFFETHIEIEGSAAIEGALSEGKGALLVTGHFGGVEYVPLYLGFKKYPVSMVARFTSEKLRASCFRQAEQFGIEIIDPDQTPNVMKAILDSLKRNRLVITQCDEIDEWRLSRQHRIFFLGKQTFLDKTLNVLSKRAAVPVVFGVMHREDNYRYKFIATSWESMASKYQRSSRTTLGEVILKFMERYIYTYPEEWYQWKKFPAIESVPATPAATAFPESLPLLEHSLREAA